MQFKARSLDSDELNSVHIRCHSGGEAIRGNNIKGKGEQSNIAISPEFLLHIQITYDLDQLPRQSLSGLRDSILGLLDTFRDGPRPIRTQLCVCLANLAIQMIEWKDVIQLVGSTLSSSGGDCVLEFLRVLPEEVTEGRKINLTVCRVETSWTHRRTLSAFHTKHLGLTHILLLGRRSYYQNEGVARRQCGPGS